MNTIFALFFIFAMDDGAMTYEWAGTYTSQQECITSGKVVYDDRVKKIESTEGHKYAYMQAACVPQQGA